MPWTVRRLRFLSPSRPTVGHGDLTAADGADDEPQLTDEQRAALVRAMSTPALTASLERMQRQFRSIAEQVNGQFSQIAEQVSGSFGRAMASQLEPVLRASRIQTSIGESLRPLIEQQLTPES